MYNMTTIVSTETCVYLKVAERVNLKSSLHKKKKKSELKDLGFPISKLTTKQKTMQC